MTMKTAGQTGSGSVLHWVYYDESADVVPFSWDRRLTFRGGIARESVGRFKADRGARRRWATYRTLRNGDVVVRAPHGAFVTGDFASSGTTVTWSDAFGVATTSGSAGEVVEVDATNRLGSICRVYKLTDRGSGTLAYAGEEMSGAHQWFNGVRVTDAWLDDTGIDLSARFISLLRLTALGLPRGASAISVERLARQASWLIRWR